jgi:hypothetical protein
VSDTFQDEYSVYVMEKKCVRQSIGKSLTAPSPSDWLTSCYHR